MYAETIGEVVSVKRQWWLKVNTKPMRKGTFDGATFPYIVKVKYVVDGVEYTRRRWIKAGEACPAIGSLVNLVYRKTKPKKCKIVYKQCLYDKNRV
ncbi:MAG: sugar ABC transporter permease [Clostridiales bacterium]|nr:sugar ABC transporter permease [Clostridiales bacterium]